MSEGDDVPEHTGPLAPSAEGDYLSAAANWLELAEETISEIARLADPGNTELSAVKAERAYLRTDARQAFDRSARLAELNIAMANACGGYQHRQRLAPFQQRYAAPSPADVKAMSEELKKRLAADQAEHEAVRLTGGDPEPESTNGDLWIDVEPPSLHRFLYKLGPQRWMWAGSHTEALKHVDNWAGAAWKDVVALRVVRRPTAAEREEFYAPQPASLPTTTPSCGCCASGLFTASAVHDEICGDCGHAGGRHNGNAIQQPDAAPTPPGNACSQFDTGDNGTYPITRSSICERCGASAQTHIQVGLRHLAEVGVDAPPPIPVRYVQAEERRKAVQELSDQEFEDMLTLAEEERLRRQSENGVAIQPRRQRTPSGTPGATQWNG